MPATAPPRQRRGHGRVTLRDVAAAAGVTAITVSRFLRSPQLVAAHTAESIRAALGQTGYVPNKQAGLLASARSDIVAALVPNLAHSIFAETLQGLSDTFAEAGMELLLAATGYSIDREEAQLRAVLGWQPRALVVTGHHHTPAALKLLADAQARGCVIVEIWDHQPGRRGGFAQVGFSHPDAGRAMAEHLLARGHRRLAYVDSAVAEDFRAHERGDGFEAAARQAGAQVQRLVAPAGEPMDAGRALLPQLLAVSPPLVACAMANDHLACGALLAAQTLGVEVPGRIALMGFGDFPLARQLRPALTTMAPPRREIGRQAARRVIAAIRDDQPARGGLALACPLIVRDSS